MADLRRISDNRPSPDALLALTGKDKRGKLTVFLGAAPGVGKTFTMLSRAKRLKDNGVDIVIGLVETHGRIETAALLEGLELLPRRAYDHKGKHLEEFDLDAALARKPRMIVVDELAHSNAPESRHPKRYQDIEELLAAGMDVWTAMNIQHLESLSEVVANIVGIPVRERVPDTVLKRADDVLLVDLPPAELITRLTEGKVYLPDNAKRAIDSFFRLGNLTALRELALRSTADRVDDEMVEYLKQNAIEGPWETSERLLACIGPDRLSENVVRTAGRLASGLNAPWIVVSVERIDSEPASAQAAMRIDETFKLAEQLGAETRRVGGRDFVDEILKLARRENITQIIVGTKPYPAWLRPFKTSLPDALTRRAAGIGVHIVTDRSGSDQMPRKSAAVMPGWKRIGNDLAVAASGVAIAAVVGLALDRFVDLPNLSMLFILSVLVSAIYFGRISSIASAVFSMFAYNYFFIEPTGSLSIAEPHEVFALLVFIVTALLAGGLATRVREQARAAAERAVTTQALYEFARKLSGTAKADDVLWAAVTQMQSTLKRNATLLMPVDGELQLSAAWPPGRELSVADMTAARWAFEKQEPAGNGTGTLPNIANQFRPLMSPSGVIGVCGFENGETALQISDERALGAILDQTAIAIDRARLAQESAKHVAQLREENFRTALLSSISHDLRTPLSTITGAVTSLRQLGDRMKPESRDDLLASIEEESARLSRFVSNLLDMTRIESGTLKGKRDWVDIGDVIRSAADRARKYFPDRIIETSIAANLPLMRGDSALLGQVLFNLLDNANKYGGSEPISVYARKHGDSIVLSVTDLGQGIAKHDLGRVFEKFYRSGKTDGRSPGTGLGLAISKGFVEALGGTIKAESPALKRRGTRITMQFPLPETDRPNKDAA